MKAKCLTGALILALMFGGAAFAADLQVSTGLSHNSGEIELQLVDPNGGWFRAVLGDLYREAVNNGGGDREAITGNLAELNFAGVVDEFVSSSQLDRSVIEDYVAQWQFAVCPPGERGCEWVTSVTGRAEPLSAEGVIVSAFADALPHIDAQGLGKVRPEIINAAMRRLNVTSKSAMRQVSRYIDAIACQFMLDVGRFNGSGADGFATSCLPGLENAVVLSQPGAPALVIDNGDPRFERQRQAFDAVTEVSVAEGIRRHGLNIQLLGLVTERQWQTMVDRFDAPIKQAFVMGFDGSVSVGIWTGLKNPAPPNPEATAAMAQIFARGGTDLSHEDILRILQEEFGSRDSNGRVPWEEMMCMAMCQVSFLQGLKEIEVTMHYGTDGAWVEAKVVVSGEELASLTTCIARCWA